MAGKLASEIKQTKAWSSLEEEVALNVQRTAAVLEQALEEALKPHGITATQYNALRIVRGAGQAGIAPALDLEGNSRGLPADDGAYVYCPASGCPRVAPAYAGLSSTPGVG